MFEKLRKHRFLFEELVKRDFTKKYKRTVLGAFWSILSPLLMLVVMSVVFSHLFGRTTPHYTIYLFAGQIVFSFFTDATTGGMSSLVSNSSIFTKVNVPKYLFLLSRNVQALINFLLTLVVFFLFVFIDGIPFSWKFIFLLFPIVCMIIFNIGVGLILSALFIIFKDTQYLYAILTQIIMYLSAIFYNINILPPKLQYLIHINPIFIYIKYFRSIVIDGNIPSLLFNGLALAYALIPLLLGALIYKKFNYKFLYYV